MACCPELLELGTNGGRLSLSQQSSSDHLSLLPESWPGDTLAGRPRALSFGMATDMEG